MAGFQSGVDRFSSLQVSLYAFSTDSEEEASKMVREEGIGFPVLYGLDGSVTARQLGAYYEKKRDIIQPCAFILWSGILVNATYSSGPVGRLEPDEALEFIESVSKG